MTSVAAASGLLAAPSGAQAPPANDNPLGALPAARPFAAAPSIVPIAAVDAARPRPSAAQPGAMGNVPLPGDLSPQARDIPRRVLHAYVNAARARNAEDPGCRLSWALLAGIGYIESDHAHGRTQPLHADGRARPAIYGPVLDGSNGVTLLDSDQGRLDGNAQFDRAVGPMQFIPSSWRTYGVDADHQGGADPQDIDDATAAAAAYLCVAGGDLGGAANDVTAVYAYNHSWAYVRAVVTVAASYAGVSPLVFGVDLIPSPAPTATPTPTAPAQPQPSAPTSSDPFVGATPEPQPRPTLRPSPRPGANSSSTPAATPEPSGATSDSPEPPGTPPASGDPSATDVPTPASS